MPDIGGNGGHTEINSEAVKSAVSELPNVETDLGEIKKNLENVSGPLEETWIGTARKSYIDVVFYMQQQLTRIQTGIGGLYGITTLTCDNRVMLDRDVAEAVTICK